MSASPRHDTETLLAELGWVRNLARRLVGQDADDLVQETWTVASSQLPRQDLPLRPWLAAITRRLASNHHRSNRHRRDREIVTARLRQSHAPPSSELVERGDALRRVVDLVLELEDPYRNVLLLRYFEGLTPARIAESSGSKASTVRTHLARGLDQLRERLDAADGGDRTRWMRALTPIAGLTPDDIAAEAARTSFPLLSSLAVLSSSMKLLVFAAPLVALLVWFAGDSSSSTSPVEQLGESSNVTALLSDVDALDLVQTDEIAEHAPRVAEGAIEPTAVDRSPGVLLVLDRATGEPVPFWRFRESTALGDRERPRPGESSIWKLGDTEFRTDAAGRAVVPVQVSSVVPVYSYEASRRMHETFRPNSRPGLDEPSPIEWMGRNAELEVDVGPRFWVDLGRPAGVAASDVLFLLNGKATPATWTTRPAFVEECEDRSLIRFRHRNVATKVNAWLHAVTLDGRYGASIRVDDALASHGHVSLRLEPRCVVLVDLLSSSEARVEAAEAFLFVGDRPLADVKTPYIERIDQLATNRRTHDGDLRLRYDAIAPGRYTLTVNSRGFEPHAMPLSLEPGVNAYRVSLKPKPMDVVIRGRVTSQTGAFHDRLRVVVRATDAAIGEAPLQTDVAWEQVDDAWVGSFEVSGASRGEQSVSLYLSDVSGNLTPPRSLLEPNYRVVEAGEESEFVLQDDFEAKRIEIRAIDAETEEPLPSFSAHLSFVDDSSTLWHESTHSGVVVLDGVRWNGTARIGGVSAAHRATETTYDELPVDGRITLRLQRGWTGYVLASAGESRLQGVDVLVDGVRSGSTDRNGMLELVYDAAPGRIELRDQGWQVRSAVGLAEDGTLTDGHLRSGAVFSVEMKEAQ
ncbi:MAG: RNA polymerase sigma factor [Planctomycetota bacterium]